MNVQIKKTDTVDDFTVSTISVNGVDFDVTAPLSNKGEWAWCGDDNWSVTEKNAASVGVDPDQLVDLISKALIDA